MSIDREYWQSKLKNIRWDQILTILGVFFTKDRGGKYGPDICCEECGCEQTIVCYLGKGFKCKKCPFKGEMIDFITRVIEIDADCFSSEVDDTDLEGFFLQFPKPVDPRQMRLFPARFLRLMWSK